VLLASFGPIVFSTGNNVLSPGGSVFTYKHVEETSKVKFAEHPILEGLSIVEWTGHDCDRVTIQCYFVDGWTEDPTVGVLEFKTAKDTATAYPLILGTTPLGHGLISQFVIEQMHSKYTRFSPTGSPIEATVDITFLEAGQLLPSLGQLASGLVNSIFS
jgi:phage protein U